MTVLLIESFAGLGSHVRAHLERRHVAIATCADGAEDSVDAAAAQLFVREAGGAVAFGDLGLDGAMLDLDSRYPMAAANGAPGLEVVRAAQSA